MVQRDISIENDLGARECDSLHLKRRVVQVFLQLWGAGLIGYGGVVT